MADVAVFRILGDVARRLWHELDAMTIELVATRRVLAERGIVIMEDELMQARVEAHEMEQLELALRPELVAFRRLVKNIDELVEEAKKWPSPWPPA
jgi:hypothetical protein